MVRGGELGKLHAELVPADGRVGQVGDGERGGVERAAGPDGGYLGVWQGFADEAFNTAVLAVVFADRAAVADGMGDDVPVLEAQFAFLGIAAGEPDAGIGQHGAIGGADAELALEQHVVPVRRLVVGRVVGFVVDQGHGDEGARAVGTAGQLDLRAAVEDGHLLPVGADRVCLDLRGMRCQRRPRPGSFRCVS